MQSAEIYRRLELENGLEITIWDLSRVYFGDYHLARLEIVCRAGRNVADEEVRVFTDGEPVEFRRIVEKIGVPSAETEAVKASLVQDFLNNALDYLSAADFPAKLARSVSRHPKKFIRTFAER